MFTAGVFTHSALRCHLTPQQQDKTDEERSANNRWRGQCRQILQQGALLPCRLTYRRLPPTVRCGVLPRMCLTQVLKMFVLLSYEVRSAGRSKAAIPALLLSGRPGAPARGAWRARGRPAESARLSWRATVLPGAPAFGTGTALLLTIVSHRYWRPCGRPRPARACRPARGTVSRRRRTTALRRLLPSSQRLVPMISGVPHGHARDRRATTRLGRRPGSPGWRDGGGRDVPSYERTSRGRIGPVTARGLSREGQ